MEYALHGLETFITRRGAATGRRPVDRKKLFHEILTTEDDERHKKDKGQ